MAELQETNMRGKEVIQNRPIIVYKENRNRRQF